MPKDKHKKTTTETTTESFFIPGTNRTLQQQIAHDAAMAIIMDLPREWIADILTWNNVLAKATDEIVTALKRQDDLNGSQT